MVSIPVTLHFYYQKRVILQKKKCYSTKEKIILQQLLLAQLCIVNLQPCHHHILVKSQAFHRNLYPIQIFWKYAVALFHIFQHLQHMDYSSLLQIKASLPKDKLKTLTHLKFLLIHFFFHFFHSFQRFKPARLLLPNNNDTRDEYKTY